MAVLQDQYKILSDWKGKKYLGLDLDWDHNNRTVHLSMIGYVAEPLTIFLQKKKPYATGSALPAHQSTLWSEGPV